MKSESVDNWTMFNFLADFILMISETRLKIYWDELLPAIVPVQNLNNVLPMLYI